MRRIQCKDSVVCKALRTVFLDKRYTKALLKLFWSVHTIVLLYMSQGMSDCWFTRAYRSEFGYPQPEFFHDKVRF